ncbi:hypothetical protein B484DRAFT_433595, partial [Ochromonadaceae sp. CCMP2298]
PLLAYLLEVIKVQLRLRFPLPQDMHAFIIIAQIPPTECRRDGLCVDSMEDAHLRCVLRYTLHHAYRIEASRLVNTSTVQVNIERARLVFGLLGLGPAFVKDSLTSIRDKRRQYRFLGLKVLDAVTAEDKYTDALFGGADRQLRVKRTIKEKILHRRAYQKAYYEANKEDISVRGKIWNVANKEHKAATAKARIDIDKPLYNQQQNAKRDLDKPHYNQQVKANRDLDRPLYNQKQKIWRDATDQTLTKEKQKARINIDRPLYNEKQRIYNRNLKKRKQEEQEEQEKPLKKRKKDEDVPAPTSDDPINPIDLTNSDIDPISRGP